MATEGETPPHPSGPRLPVTGGVLGLDSLELRASTLTSWPPGLRPWWQQRAKEADGARFPPAWASAEAAPRYPWGIEGTLLPTAGNRGSVSFPGAFSRRVAGVLAGSAL